MPNRFGDELAGDTATTGTNRFGDKPSGEGPGAILGAVQGVNVGALSDILGAPVDIATAGLNVGARALGLPEIQDPFLGSEQLRRGLTKVGAAPTEEQVAASPREFQLGFQGGRVVGQSVPFAGAPLAAARAGVKSAGLLTPIVQAAKTRPGAFATAEAGAALGAAQGSVIAELAAPGQELPRVAAEIVGGFLNPAGLAAKTVAKVSGGARQAAQAFTPAGRRARASEVLSQALTDAGEDPLAVARSLTAADQITTPLTAGQKSGSPTLIAIESKLASQNAQFSDVSRGRMKQAFADMRGVVDNLAATGDPAAIRQAAIARQAYFDDILTQRVSVAQRQAAEAAASIPATGTKRAASESVFQTLDSAMKEVRGVERGLWERIPKDIQVVPEGLQRARDRVRGMLLQEEPLPLAATLKRVLGQQTSTGELLKMRARLLAQSRDLRAQNRLSEASHNTILAEGVLDDLMRLEIPESVAARQFSVQLNDKFSRTFAGDALAEKATGANRIPPEILLERAFGAGGTQAEARFRQMAEAAGFTGTEAAAPARANVFGAAVQSEQEQFIALMAQKTMKDGVVDPQRLQKFLTDNAQLLARFPELQKSLADAGQATALLRTAERVQGKATQAVAKKAAFAKVAGEENPAAAIGRVFSGGNPQRDFGQLARLAKNSGPGAVGGLRTSTLDWAMTQARTAGGIDFQRFNDTLMSPISRGRPSIVGMMKQNQIMSAEQANGLRRIVTRAVELDDAVRTGHRIDKVVGDPDAMFDLIVRMTGAQVGGLSPIATTSGSGILVAGAGSRFARNLFEKVPASRVTQVLIEAAESPQFAATLLRRVGPQRQKLTEAAVQAIKDPANAVAIMNRWRASQPYRALERQVNAFLLQAGFVEESEGAGQ